MKILYAIQGTGNGHVSRAKAIIPHLIKRGDLDVLVSGTQSEIELNHPIKYRFIGMGFIFGKKGGVDFINTYKKSKLKQFWKEVQSLPINNYDIVINDFEPVSAWACFKAKKHCIGLSNQLAVLSPGTPQPEHEDLIGKFVLRNYAPVSVAYGIHFQSYNEFIYTPIIREEVRKMRVTKENHYTVYLPAYSDQTIVKVLSQISEIKWEVFSKHSQEFKEIGNVDIQPINEGKFLKSLSSCEGILCAAGFATPAEALFLGKKLMVIPMKKQFEQQCNASALKEMGVPVLKSLKSKHLNKLKSWSQSSQNIQVDWPDKTQEIVQKIFDDDIHYSDFFTKYITSEQFVPNSLR